MSPIRCQYDLNQSGSNLTAWVVSVMLGLIYEANFCYFVGDCRGNGGSPAGGERGLVFPGPLLL